jgi:sugar lactone lactonase YvrE
MNCAHGGQGAELRRLLALGLLAVACGAVSAQTTLGFVLPRAATTSAGVYDAQQRLVRTLWSGERLGAGPHRRRLDVALAAGQQVLLIHHDVRAVWEGVIGNSSALFGGPQVHRAFHFPSGLALDGHRLYLATGYNEGQRGVQALDVRDPQRALRPFDSGDPFIGQSMLATDGQRVVAAHTGGLSRGSFVLAYDVATGRRHPWPEGRPICLAWHQGGTVCHAGQDYRGVIDLHETPDDVPTGIALQRDGPLLAVARTRRGEVALFDKHSGRRVGALRAALQPGRTNQIAFAPGGDLWVLTRDGALRLSTRGALGEVKARVSGLAAPLALAVHPADEDALWIADGASSQQLKRFDREGRLVARIGRAGGALDGDPRVSDDRLCFALTGAREQSALAVAADGSLWVVDTCNNRLLHLDADGRVRSRVAYLPASYAAAADANDATRVFANFMELRVDASSPLKPGAWTLERNWLPGLPAELRDGETGNWAYPGFRSVTTIGGRTLAQVGSGGREAVVELPAHGPLRILRRLAAPLPGATRKVLYENGDLGWALLGAGTQTLLRQRFLGFDARGEARWAEAPERIASVPMRPGSPHDRGAFSGLVGPRFPVTASGRVILFDPSVTGNEGFHLGAVEVGADDWLWMASPSAPLDGRGSFQTREADRKLRAADRGIQYGGNVVMALERQIVFGFHGEFYTDQTNGKVGQANQFMHFHDSGLFIQQFGLPSTRATIDAEPGVSGNAFSPTLVRAGDRLYLHHNDESTHGGVHRWRIDGWQSIGELRGGASGAAVLELR